MGAFEKFNRTENYPRYQVTYAKAKDLVGKQWPVTWLGSYETKLYGRKPYVDILDSKAEHVRVSLPAYMLDSVDEMAHSAECMAEIKAGIVSCIFTAVHTKRGNDTVTVKWIETESKADIDSNELPF